MPDRDIELTLSVASGRWGEHSLSGPAHLRLTSDALLLNATRGPSLRVNLVELTGAGWRTGSMAVHGPPGSIVMETASGLDRAWVALVARACPLPEFTRGHRRLGSRRGGPHDAQSRFLAPLLQARRRLHEESDLDQRVASLDPSAIRERFVQVIENLATDAYPASAPDRRALTAELTEAMEPLFERVRLLEASAIRFRRAQEEERFVAWREWVASASAVFAHADRGWASAAPLLPPRGAR